MDPFEPPFILSIDVGTSSTRTLLFDRSGNPLLDTLSRQDYKITPQPGGIVEADPDLLLQSIWHCIDETLQKSGSLAPQVIAVSSCTFAGSTLALDELNRPLTPLWLYSDTRSESDAEILKERLDEPAAHQRTGVPFFSAYQPARILWIRRELPDTFNKTKRWVTLGEFMAHSLFGEMKVSTSIASWTGLLNIHTLEWDQELLAALPVDPQSLSPLVDASQSWVELRPEFRQRWPALSRAVWFPAIGDGAAANLGSGCNSPAQVAITIGTSSAVRATFDGEVPLLPAGLWCYRINQRSLLLGGALNEGGSIYAWLVEMLNLQNAANLEAELKALPPDSAGLTFLPFIAGERSPGWHGEARAMIAGMSLTTSPLQILQAGMEAVAYRIAEVYALLRPLLPGEPEILTSGGALEASPAWNQILANVLGRPVIQSRTDESSARGAALLALEAMGLIGNVQDAPRFDGPVILQDAHSHEIYQQARRRQQDLYNRFIAS